MFLAGCNCFFRPERTLHFADMSFAKEEHTDTGLTNSSADGIRKCSIDDGFLEWQILAFRTAGFVKLGNQRSFVYFLCKIQLFFRSTSSIISSDFFLPNVFD